MWTCSPLTDFMFPLETYLTLRSIHCSSWLVMFWIFHSVKLATITPGLNEHVLAFMPSFLIASFLKSRKPT